MNFININNVKIHYNTNGNGDPTIFLHGLSDSSDFFTSLTSKLNGLKVIRPDLMGHGESDKDTDISIEILTEDIRDLLDKLEVKRVNIMGFSMGSLVAQNFALEFPELVKSLIMCSGYSRCNPELSQTFKNLEKITAHGGIPAFFDEMIKLVYIPEYLLKHAEIFQYKKVAVEMNSKTVIEKCLVICRNFDVESKLSEIDVPSYIMYGSGDILIPPENSQDMHDAMGNSELLSFPTGHNFFLPENIKKIAMEIQRFLLRI